MAKVKRDAFLYLAPKAPKDEFAQCGTCSLFVESANHCSILGSAVHVTASMSCGFYLHGTPKPKNAAIRKVVTAQEAGLVDRQVRCENCEYVEGKTCGLYRKLNTRLPAYFDLDARIDPQGCCNAQQPKAPPKQWDRRKLYDHPR